MIRQALKYIAVLANISVALVVIYLLFASRFTVAPSQELRYEDFIAILLTALAVMMGVAAFLVALGAIWGYRSAKEMILQAAEKTAEEVAKPIAAQTARDQADAIVPQAVEEALKARAEYGVDDTMAAQIAMVVDEVEAQEDEPGEHLPDNSGPLERGPG